MQKCSENLASGYKIRHAKNMVENSVHAFAAQFTHSRTGVCMPLFVYSSAHHAQYSTLLRTCLIDHVIIISLL